MLEGVKSTHKIIAVDRGEIKSKRLDAIIELHKKIEVFNLKNTQNLLNF